MKNIFCLLGMHNWEDRLDYEGKEGHFIVQKCMYCPEKRVYTTYERFGEPYLHQVNMNKLGNELRKELGLE